MKWHVFQMFDTLAEDLSNQGIDPLLCAVLRALWLAERNADPLPGESKLPAATWAGTAKFIGDIATALFTGERRSALQWIEAQAAWRHKRDAEHYDRGVSPAEVNADCATLAAIIQRNAALVAGFAERVATLWPAADTDAR